MTDFHDELHQAIERYRQALGPTERLVFDLVTDALVERTIYGNRTGEITGILGPANEPPATPVAAAEDRLPRRRNPRIGCEENHGTWIHGRPHSCPKWTRP